MKSHTESFSHLVEHTVEKGSVPTIITREYDDQQLAARLRLSVCTLRSWRCRYPERLPPGIKIGRNWLYAVDKVDKWLESKDVGATRSLSQAKSPFKYPQTIIGRRGRPKKK